MTTTRAPCPACDRGPRDRALSITTDERGRVAYCHRCGYVETDAREVNHARRVVEQHDGTPLEWSARAQAIWNRTEDLASSLGAKYLQHRGCLLPPADGDLRFLAATEIYPPTLVARITDAITCEPLSLHFTRLARDGSGKAGTACDKSLLSGHRKKGGVIRLWPNDAVIHGLAIAEGIETALAAAHAYTPTWSCVDAGNLAQFPVLANIAALTIFADHDDAGLAAATQCATRWLEHGREVCVLTPRTAGRDAADEVALS